jgi:hypothetical protein
MTFNYLRIGGRGVMEAPTRYDGLLAALPVSLAGGTVAGWLSTAPTLAGVGAGGIVATVILAVSLFAAPPR